ncbi:MAG: 3-deoxy-7-phosphoheptulonate synthase [candidate division NC10 bacterium RIFCSPLOWO2_02_FULL_66_22]|nr:MAG: 3-deoxy-7-phosphoheptulonate synthase [candidate division NC10 bacterium RIFCSPLOWO2_02_FULL_66_22]
MIIVMKGTATETDLQRVIQTVEELGYQPHVIRGTQRSVIGAIGDERGKARLQSLEAMPGVESVVPILQPFKLASREFKPTRTVVKVRDVEIGGDRVVVMAGPCSVENEDQILETARAVKEAGATILRGGAFKPRTSPYAFQGLGEEGLRLLAAAREETGLAIVTEVLKSEDVDLVAETADMIQIGARNVQNFALLKRVGEVGKPVLLKRGMATTIQEFLMAAEYVLSEGTYDVVLCERGIRTFETATRFTLDLNAVPVLKKHSHLPVIVDPSHGTGHWEYVTPMAKAAIACGADGLMVEVHIRPEMAMSDGVQSLKPATFRRLMQEIAPFVEAAGRKL